MLCMHAGQTPPWEAEAHRPACRLAGVGPDQPGGATLAGQGAGAGYRLLSTITRHIRPQTMPSPQPVSSLMDTCAGWTRGQLPCRAEPGKGRSTGCSCRSRAVGTRWCALARRATGARCAGMWPRYCSCAVPAGVCCCGPGLAPRQQAWRLLEANGGHQCRAGRRRQSARRCSRA